MENELISRSDAIKRAKAAEIEMGSINGIKAVPMESVIKFLEIVPAVDAVPVESLGKIGKLFLPYKGCPRGHVGRMGVPATLEEEALQWGVITDVDGGRWVPVVEDVLHELIEKAKTVDVVEDVRLIDMNTLWQCETCFHHGTNGCKTWCDTGESYRPAASKFKIIDPESLRPKGRWELMGEADYKCSVCGFRFTSGDPIEMFPYCRCGAKMEE